MVLGPLDRRMLKTRCQACAKRRIKVCAYIPAPALDAYSFSALDRHHAFTARRRNSTAGPRLEISARKLSLSVRNLTKYPSTRLPGCRQRWRTLLSRDFSLFSFREMTLQDPTLISMALSPRFKFLQVSMMPWRQLDLWIYATPLRPSENEGQLQRRPCSLIRTLSPPSNTT